MIESTTLSWILVLALLPTGGWFLVRGVRPGPTRADRISHLAHALMAATMAAMLWPTS